MATLNTPQPPHGGAFAAKNSEVEDNGAFATTPHVGPDSQDGHDPEHPEGSHDHVRGHYYDASATHHVYLPEDHQFEAPRFSSKPQEHKSDQKEHKKTSPFAPNLPFSQRVSLTELLIALVITALLGILPSLIFEQFKRPIPYQKIEFDAPSESNIEDDDDENALDRLLRGKDSELALDLRFDHEVEDQSMSEELTAGLSIALPLGVEFAFTILSHRTHTKGLVEEMSSIVAVNGLAQGLQLGVSTFLKRYVGYFRPDFYHRCKFNPTTRQCRRKKGEEEGRQSFSSVEASTAFCGCLLLTLFLNYKLGVVAWRRRYRRKLDALVAADGATVASRRAKWELATARFLSVVFLAPLALPLYVAASGVHENRNHPADVATGALLGSSAAVYMFGLWFN